MNPLNHIAIIMDGNGRYAKQQGKPRTYGHFKGTENARNIAIEAKELGVKTLTLYAFSSENWKRPKSEIDYLMGLPKVFFQSYLKELMEKNIRIKMIGSFAGLPKGVSDIFQAAIDETKNNTAMDLVFAMNYGSQNEIVEAVKSYTREVVNKKRGNDLDAAGFFDYFQSRSAGAVDLLIRTGGDQRISNFLLWQIAYAELIFVKDYWPDFTPERFRQTIVQYQERERRYGGLSE
ncbi:MAG: di-trans,poly-cis-decaprenylcistransferase [Erysipelotrichaceae bacterium]|jgi:undecaprenyl diphosphate synthase|nr:di-trans,poly-cis-decaprenylcistransferase [Erysipelotrichaceae bacterium]